MNQREVAAAKTVKPQQQMKTHALRIATATTNSKSRDRSGSGSVWRHPLIACLSVPSASRDLEPPESTAPVRCRAATSLESRAPVGGSLRTADAPPATPPHPRVSSAESSPPPSWPRMSPHSNNNNNNNNNNNRLPVLPARLPDCAPSLLPSLLSAHPSLHLLLLHPPLTPRLLLLPTLAHHCSLDSRTPPRAATANRRALPRQPFPLQQAPLSPIASWTSTPSAQSP
jgi:hypothetical protein